MWGITLLPISENLTQIIVWLLVLIGSYITGQMIFQVKTIGNGEEIEFNSFELQDEKVAFILPAFNEVSTIGELVAKIRQLYKNSLILVVDNNSTDATAQAATENGAEVIFEKKQGKGYAVKTGFNYLSSLPLDAIIMMDSDYTYKPKDAEKLLQEATNGKHGVILGSRLLGNREKGALTKFNYIGNRIFSIIANFLYRVKHTDICTGYWLFRPKVLEVFLETGIKSGGFGLETEMITLLAQHRITTKEVPVTYGIRTGRKTHLHPIKDGFRILTVLIANKLPRRNN